MNSDNTPLHQENYKTENDISNLLFKRLSVLKRGPFQKQIQDNGPCGARASGKPFCIYDNRLVGTIQIIFSFLINLNRNVNKISQESPMFFSLLNLKV